MTRTSRTTGKSRNRKLASGAAGPGIIADAVPDLSIDAADTNGVIAFTVTKVDAIRQMTSIARRAGFDYDALVSATKAVRDNLGLRRPRRSKKLPRSPARREVVAFFRAVDAGGSLRDQVMLRVLTYTGVRVAELIAIQREHVDLDTLTIRIVQGKGSKDRTVLFPASFRLALQAFIDRGPRTGPLFLSRLRKPLSTRRVQQIVADYGKAAGVADLHPHAFRHHALTELTRAGLSDAQIQLLSGHASKKSLETYQHLALADVRDDYQAAAKGWGL